MRGHVKAWILEGEVKDKVEGQLWRGGSEGSSVGVKCWVMCESSGVEDQM